MKTYLVISQIIYTCALAPWLIIWAMSTMVFDSGIHLSNSFFFILITIYPLALLACGITAWVIRNRRRRTAILVNLIPSLWIIGIGGLLLLL